MIEFDELAIRNAFIKDIEEIFADEYATIGTEVIVSASDSQETTFPCCLVNLLNPLSNERYDANDGSFRYVDFSLNCDLYSNALENNTATDSVIRLSQILIKGILTKYGTFVVTRNNDVPFRTDVKRRTVTFRCTYDNENKIIYSL